MEKVGTNDLERWPKTTNVYIMADRSEKDKDRKEDDELDELLDSELFFEY